MQIIRETTENRFQFHVAFTLSYMVSFLAILNCINAVTEFIGVRTSLDTTVCYILLWGSVAYTAVEGILLRRCRIKDLGCFAFMVAAWLLTALLFPQNTEFMFTSLTDLEGNPFYLLFLYSMPACLLMAYLSDFLLFYQVLLRFSYIVILLSAFVYFFCAESSASQYMTLSYNMLLQVICLLFHRPKKKLLHYMFLVLGFIVIIIGGSRGALVGLLAGVIMRCLFTGVSLKRKIIWIVIFALAGSCFLVFYTSILMMVAGLLASLKIESRNINAFLTSSFAASSGRTEIFEKLLEQLTLSGKGLYGDRVILYGQRNVYAHNLFLEWLVDFGMPGGIFLSIVYLIWLIKTVLKSQGILRNIILILIPTGFIKLMLSGSYLEQEPAFYLLLGACLNTITYHPLNSEKEF